MKLLTIVFSNHCDLDCTYCCIGSKGLSPILSVDDAYSFIKSNMDPEDNVLEFYGGEPYEHTEQMYSIVDMLRCDGLIDKFFIRAYTNGLSLFKNYYADMFSVYDADELLISLDGLTYNNNSQRFKYKEDFETVLNNIKLIAKKRIENRLPINTTLSQVIFGKDKAQNMLNVFNYFYNDVSCFSYELLTVWNDDKTVVVPKDVFKKFIDNMWKIAHFIVQFDTNGEKSLFVCKELLSSNHYFVEKEKCCSSIARAISPRGNVYMCRDHAANEEHMFYGQHVIQFSNKNNLKMKDGGFDHIHKYENTHTPCVVKDMQYMFSSDVDKLYWLRDDFQEFIIRPLLEVVLAINSKDRSKELCDIIENYIKEKDTIWHVLYEKQ